MQGFNRYIPPDYDPKQNSTLNSHQGKKHALGKRAKDIDKGVLVVRFELPFNIWCESCGNHIGAGVRYNAQKKKVGNYYSTPIYQFKCKCHLCSNWFEIRTDPQNAAYVVHAGAKKKDEDWDPVANGGFATHDTDAPSADQPPADAFAATEKTVDQQTWAKQKATRLTELSDLSDKLSADPYEVSTNLRRRFREEKKVMLEKQGRDEGLREKYGLHEGVDLGEEDVELSRSKWEAGRERVGLPIEAGSGSNDETIAGISTKSTSSVAVIRNGKARASGGTPGMPSLAQALRTSTKRKYDPFADVADAFLSSPGAVRGAPKSRGQIKDSATIAATPAKIVPAAEKVAVTPGLANGLLAGYGSD